MNTIKKFMVLGLVMLLAAGTVFAGGSQGGSSGGGGSATIVVGGWPSGDVAFKAALPGFNEKYPNINVEFEFMPTANYMPSLATALAAGNNAPDVAGIHESYIAQYRDSPALDNLFDPPYNAGQYEKDIAAFKWVNCVSSDGKALRAIPWDMGPATMFYRADVFQDAGLPTDPDEVAKYMSTWQGVLDAAKKISIPGKRWFIVNASYLYEILFFNRGFYDKDLNLQLDREGDIETLKAVIEIRKNGWDMNALVNSTESNAAQANGSLGVVIRGCWQGGFLKSAIDPKATGYWRIAVLPAGIPSSNNGGSYVAIPSQGKKKDAAWAFLQYMLTTVKGQNDMFQAVDYFPAYMPAWKDPIYQFEDPYFGGQKTRALWAKIASEIKPEYTTIMDATIVPLIYNSVNNSLSKGLDPAGIKAAFIADIEAATAELKRQQIQILRDAGVWNK
jgi:multiple sugar transport system substrate-binding protein